MYDLANKQLKPIYSVSATSMYQTGVVDYKNSKVYYAMWGNNGIQLLVITRLDTN